MNMKFVEWARRNKLVVLLALSTFCFFVSTVALVANRKYDGLQTTLSYINQTAATSLGYSSTTAMTPVPKTLNYRLPRSIVPLNYKLLLLPNLVDKTYRGAVRISLNVLKTTDNIVLHSSNLTIGDVNVRNLDDSDIKITSLTASADLRELLFINLKQKLSKGLYYLDIQFSGRLDKKLVSFYASSLKNGGTMVASKFQPTYARQAFPCFDEPDFKATYDITLVKPPSHVALSNMNVVSVTSDTETNTEAVTFATSVPMSSYLACFVICEFIYKETEINSNGIGKNFKLRSYAQKNEIHKIDFAQDIGKRATEFYIKYYEVPFPLPKLDMIAIPDYVSGATEHWGLITYRETAFLVDNSTASSRNKINVANTISHELAHMWFGNLVTVSWWDDLWLNEGFATYMQVKALNAIEPSWTMLEQFLTRTLHSVLVTDAKLSSHPIVQTVNTPDEITAIFDSISYNKGSSVLRMLEGFIGEENFRRGVTDYLKKFEYGNTITQDLLSCLEPYFKKDNPQLNISYIMDTWTRQKGYPVVTVSKSDAPNTYILTQSRFLLDPKAKYADDSQFKYRWFIPITYKTNKGVTESILWFPDTEQNVKITLNPEETWLKLNNNQTGYYRVNYPIDMWGQLTEQLKNKSAQLTISDRAHLLNEIFALAEAQLVPYPLALELISYLTVERDFVPWEAASTIFVSLENKLQNTLAREDLMKFVQRLIEPLYILQSWEKTDNNVIVGLLRTKILSMATRFELPNAERKVRDLFLRWLNNYGTVDQFDIEPDLRDFVYQHGMKLATASDWQKLWEIYLKEGDAQEQTKLRAALAAPRDSNLLKRYLLLAWDEKNIRSQDYLNVLQYISINPSGTSLVWDSVRTRWPQLVERFSLNNRYLGNMIPGITNNFNTDLKLKEMEEFFAQYPNAGAGETARKRALETVRNNIRWVNQNQPAVAAWLTEHTS